MTWTTYAGLKTNITNWLGRSDLTDYYDDWIRLFEFAAARKLKTEGMQASTSLTTTSGSVALPSDYLGTIALRWAGSTAITLDYLHPTILDSLYPLGSSTSGSPQSYTIRAGNIEVRPVSDSSQITLNYYARDTAAATTLDWLFTNHPDAYLFGSLAESGGYTDDAEKLMMWKARRDEVFDEIAKDNFRLRGGLAIRTLGHTP